MISPQEKAVFLFYSFYSVEIDISWEQAKQCSLIAVKEIIASGCTLPSNNTHYGCNEEATEYWNEVKNEIKKL